MTKKILLIGILFSLLTSFSYADSLNDDMIEKIKMPNKYPVTDLIFLEGNLFVVTGYHGVCFSEDGETWEIGRSSSNFLPNRIINIVYNGKEFVIIGRLRVAFSKDGRNWESFESNLEDVVEGRVYTEESFDSESKAAIITKNSEGSFYHDFPKAVTFHKGKYIASCANSGRLIVSDDAIKWRELNEQETEVGLGGRQYWDIMSNGEIAVAGGNSGKRATSKDGIYWKDATDPFVPFTMSTTKEERIHYYRTTKDIKQIIWDGTQFIALADGKGLGSEDSITISTSLDGYDWDMKKVFSNENPINFQMTSGGYERIEKMIWTGNEYILLKTVRTSKGHEAPEGYMEMDVESVLVKSSDLETWTELRRFDEEEDIKSIASKGNKLFVGGKHIYIITI